MRHVSGFIDVVEIGPYQKKSISHLSNYPHLALCYKFIQIYKFELQTQMSSNGQLNRSIRKQHHQHLHSVEIKQIKELNVKIKSKCLASRSSKLKCSQSIDITGTFRHIID
jgi:hypothetical protein